MNAIEFKDLCKTYQARGEKRHALQGLNLDIPQGQIYGFGGPPPAPRDPPGR